MRRRPRDARAGPRAAARSRSQERDIESDDACCGPTSNGSRSLRSTARRPSSCSWTNPSSSAVLDMVDSRMSYTVGTRSRMRRQPDVDKPGEKLALGRRRAAVALPPGADAGPQDGQGDDLLAGARGLHARELDPDPPGSVGLRQVRQARRRLQRRVAGHARSARSCGPRVSTTSPCSVPATSARRSRPRTSSPTTASVWSPIFDVDRSKVGHADRDRWPSATTPSCGR